MLDLPMFPPLGRVYVNNKPEWNESKQKHERVPWNYAAGRKVRWVNDPACRMDYGTALSTEQPISMIIGTDETDKRIVLDFDGDVLDGTTRDLNLIRQGMGWASQEAWKIAEPFLKAGCAAEISSSGKNLHVFARVPNKSIFDGRSNELLLPDRKKVEVFWFHKLIAFGGGQWRGDGHFDIDVTDLIRPIAAKLPIKAVRAEVNFEAGPVPEWNGPTDDDELIEMALLDSDKKHPVSAFFNDPNPIVPPNSKAPFRALWMGDARILSQIWPSSDADRFDRNKADQAIMGHFAKLTGKDAARMDRLFRQSGLMRDKYRDRPDDYARPTISKAIAGCNHVTGQGLGLTPPDSASIRNSTGEITENAVALAFAEQFQGRLRYVAGQWWCWNNTIWIRDQTNVAYALAREFCHRGTDGAGKHTTVKFVSAVLKHASADRRLVGHMADFDRDDWMLNTPTGIVNLRTGAIEPLHDSSHLMTKITGIGPDFDAQCPQWMAFLNEIFDGDQGRIDYLQRFAGLSLTGDISEHVLIFAYGLGTNGKSVTLDTITAIMGDYACETPSETLMSKRNGPSHPTELAALHGARLVYASELEDGRQWNEALLKKLTGDPTITARFMGKDFFTYPRKFKLLIVGNHQPEIRAVDEAMRRRFRLFPFNVTVLPEKRIPNLSAKLLTAEGPAILAWMINGCAQVRQSGLAIPEAVKIATGDYLADEDQFGRFVEENCDTTDPRVWTQVLTLYDYYVPWAKRTGEKMIFTMKRFSKGLRDRGFTHYRTNQAKGFYGIQIKNGIMESGLPLPAPRVPD